MAVCINKRDPEYQALKTMSGLSDFSLDAFVSSYLNKYGVFPHLDEIPNADSQPYLWELLSVKSYGDLLAAPIEKILEYTKTDNILDANARLNDIHRDLELHLTEIGESFVTIEGRHRPTKWLGYNDKGFKLAPMASVEESTGILNNILLRLARYYGIDMIPVSIEDLLSDEWKDVVPNAAISKAFIYDGNIYINTDLMSIDSKLHEMMHLILGSVRVLEPKLYMAMVNAMENLPDYENRSLAYLGRTRNDINEELLVSEFSKFMTGRLSAFNELKTPELHQIIYNVNRAIDSSIAGVLSAATIQPNDLFRSTLNSLISRLGSVVGNSTYNGTLDIEGAEVHRIMANTKEDLIKLGKLEEYCE